MWSRSPQPSLSGAAQKTAVGPDPAGWTEVTIPIESVEAAVPELLPLGAEAEVVAPDDLRNEIIQARRAMSRICGEPANDAHPPAES